MANIQLHAFLQINFNSTFTFLGSGVTSPPMKPITPPTAQPIMPIPPPKPAQPIMDMSSAPLISQQPMTQPMMHPVQPIMPPTQPIMATTQPLMSAAPMMPTQPLISGVQPMMQANPPLIPSLPSQMAPLIPGMQPNVALTQNILQGMISPPAIPQMRSPPNMIQPITSTPLPAGLISPPPELQGMVTMPSLPAEWAVPQASRLKYTQLFNQTDRNKTGFLSGPQARNILVQSRLPQATLAKIWALSDLDCDGNLGKYQID